MVPAQRELALKLYPLSTMASGHQLQEIQNALGFSTDFQKSVLRLLTSQHLTVGFHLGAENIQ